MHADRPGHPDCRRARRGARAGHHAPRHQAGEHLRHHARARQGARLRAGEAGAEGELEQAVLAETGSFQAHTDPGFAMGTAGYMAPEQIRGEGVDARTDVFALGAVLYELVTGRPAFTGRTLGIVQDAVLNRPPEPVLTQKPDAPPRLAELIERCLEKDPDLRYQSAADLRADLRRLSRDRTTPATGTQAWSRATTPVRRGPSRRGLTAAVAATALVAAGLVGWFLLGRASRAGGPSPRLVPFTALPGLLRKPAFSPEGNQIAFCWNGGAGEAFSLYTQLFDAGSPLRLTTSPGEDDSPAWSPDGRFIAFLRNSAQGAGYFVVPALGGPERRVRPSFGVPLLARAQHRLVARRHPARHRRPRTGGQSAQHPARRARWSRRCAPVLDHPMRVPPEPHVLRRWANARLRRRAGLPGAGHLRDRAARRPAAPSDDRRAPHRGHDVERRRQQSHLLVQPRRPLRHLAGARRRRGAAAGERRRRGCVRADAGAAQRLARVPAASCRLEHLADAGARL